MDLQALAGLSQQAPEEAIAQLLRDKPISWEQAPRDKTADWLKSAGYLCQLLRMRGDNQQALQLARAGSRRTLRLRLEEALCACLCGELPAAQELIEQDPQVQRVLGPVVAALSHGTVALPRRAKSEGLKRLHAAAKAVGEVAGGRAGASVRTARNVQDQTFIRAIELAAELRGKIHAASKRNLLSYLRSDDVRRHRQLAVATIEDAAGANVVLDVPAPALREVLPTDVWQFLLGVQLRACRDDAARVAGLLRNTQSQDFPQHTHAAYALWRGFSELRSSPKRAGHWFTRALGARGESSQLIVLETLRGSYLVAQQRLQLDGPSFDSVHELTAKAKRFLNRLERNGARVEAALLALHVSQLLLERFRSLAAPAELDDWVKRARALTPHLGADSERAAQALACSEGRVLLASDAQRALRLAQQVLERDPRHVDAWSLKIAAARRLKHPKLGDWIVRAHQETADPSFSRESERVLIERGELQPFERLHAKQVRPGELLVEMFRCLRAPGTTQAHANEARLWEQAWERARGVAQKLDARGRGAFDAAVLGHALARFDTETCTGLLAQMLSTSPGTLHVDLVVSMLLSDEASPTEPPQGRVRLMGELLAKEVAAATAFPSLLGSLARLDQRRLGERLLLTNALHLSSRTVEACQRQLLWIPGEWGPGALFDEIHDRLHPEVCLHQLLEEASSDEPPRDPFRPEPDHEGDVDEGEAIDAAEIARGIDELGLLVKLFRIDVAKLKALPLERQADFLDLLADFDDSSRPGALSDARKFVERFGVAKSAAAPVPKAFKATSSKEKNQQKRARRQRKQGKGGQR